MRHLRTLLRCIVLISAFVLAEQAHAFYDPHRGVWLSKDPIGERGGINLYAFCGNNGVNHIDPVGNTFLSGSNQYMNLDVSSRLLKHEYICGQFLLERQWQISPASHGDEIPSAVGYYIIQTVTWDGVETKCATGIDEPFHYTFTEAAPIESSFYGDLPTVTDDHFRNMPTNFPTKSIADRLSGRTKGPFGGPCTRGEFTVTATAAIYEITKLPATFRPPDLRGPAGEYPWTDQTVNGLPSPISNQVSETLKATWNCCGSKQPTSVVVNKTVKPGSQTDVSVTWGIPIQNAVPSQAVPNSAPVEVPVMVGVP
jgi:hypothetical protein